MNSNMSGRPGKNRRFFVGIVSVLWGKRFLIFIGTVSIVFLVSNFRFIGTEGKMWGKKSITNRYSWQGLRDNGEVSEKDILKVIKFCVGKAGERTYAWRSAR